MAQVHAAMVWSDGRRGRDRRRRKRGHMIGASGTENPGGGRDLGPFIRMNDDMLCTFDTDGSAVWLSPHWEQTLQWPLSRLTGPGLLSIMHAEDIGCFRETFARSRDEAGVVRQMSRLSVPGRASRATAATAGSNGACVRRKPSCTAARATSRSIAARSAAWRSSAASFSRSSTAFPITST